FTGPILQPEDAATQCAFPDTFDPSTDPADDRSVDPGSTLSLPPGRYHDIVVRGSAGQAGTLLLEGGEYDFSSLRVFRGAQLLFAAPSVVRVATDVFRIGDLSVIGPKPNSGVSASDIRLYSNGARVSFRRRAEVHALLCAPAGRVVL